MEKDDDETSNLLYINISCVLKTVSDSWKG